MGKRFIDTSMFSGMMTAGKERLESQVEIVNALNVFPVPDGDTGSNMLQTMQSGVRQLGEKDFVSAGAAANAFAFGLLMGARGNSGVILSQLFRGFAEQLEEKETLTVHDLAAGLKAGVDQAYRSVMKPVEGTLLSVSRDAAEAGLKAAQNTDDPAEWMREVLREAKQSLERTPDQLPILKKVGVVDSGGQGLVFIYEGFLAALEGTPAALPERSDVPEHVRPAKAMPAQSRIDTEEIDHRYDLEFFIVSDRQLDSGITDKLRNRFCELGDSVLVVPSKEGVKVHVHSDAPGEVLNEALAWGELSRIHIENMRDKHRELSQKAAESVESAAEPGDSPEAAPVSETDKPFGVVAVASGKGISDILKNLGADEILDGGQNMNPSTEDILRAVARVHAECVFVLPNNANIIMAAEQAAEVSGRKVVVIPTRTVPQGLSAVLSFREDAGAGENEKEMKQAAFRVKSGHVTFAVRGSEFDHVEIRENDYLGLLENKIVVSEPDLFQASCRLIQSMIGEDDEVLTILSGQDADEEVTERIRQWAEKQFPQLEVEMHAGGQPLYYYIVAVE